MQRKLLTICQVLSLPFPLNSPKLETHSLATPFTHHHERAEHVHGGVRDAVVVALDALHHLFANLHTHKKKCDTVQELSLNENDLRE